MRHLFAAGAIVALTLLGIFVFPGHTTLQSDTQIYIPILERLWNPAVFGREMLALKPHVAWTVYDESALLGRRLSGLDFETVLMVEQVLCRVIAVWGLYLIGRRFLASKVAAMMVAAVVGLGATILGPSVLSLEYEPVPRGFAVCLLYAAIGLALGGRYLAASVVTSIAFLYHAPTTLPVWAVLGVVIAMRREWRALIPPVAAAAVLVALRQVQPGITEAQHFFSRIPPDIEALERLRASYTWVTLWPEGTYMHYVCGCGLVLGALYRLRGSLEKRDWVILAGLPVIGLASIPLSWLLLEKLKWALMPQVQQARMALFTTVVLEIMCVVAAAKAARWVERWLWLLPAFTIPVHVTLNGVYEVRHVVLVAGLAAVAASAFAGPLALRGTLTAAVALGGALLIPGYGGVVNYARIHSAELDDVARWARQSTPVEAMFAFPASGKSLEVGIFRARSLRAVWVDWKAGGQVNYFDDLGREWWRRWQKQLAGEIPGDVDFAVYPKGKQPKERGVAYENAKFVVVRWR